MNLQIKEEIADTCVFQDENVLEGEKAMEKNDKFSKLEKPENIIDEMQYSSSLNEEHHKIENFLNRVKKETGFNLTAEEIQIKDECLFEATDSNSEYKSNNKLINEEMNNPDNFNDELDSEHSTADDDKTTSKNCNLTSSEGGTNREMDQNVDNVKRLKCAKCHKAFTYLSRLKIHNRTHTGEKPYECDVCNKKFTIKNHLIVHKRTHNNERPYKCTVCQKAFINNSNLSQHMRMHTGEKPFKCLICQYKCARTVHLKSHMRIHTGEKPFTCKYCKKKFNQSSNLKVHMQTHHCDKI